MSKLKRFGSSTQPQELGLLASLFLSFFIGVYSQGLMIEGLFNETVSCDAILWWSFNNVLSLLYSCYVSEKAKTHGQGLDNKERKEVKVKS
jgi:hypothetical protein